MSKMIGTLGQASLTSGSTLSMTALRATKMTSNLLGNDNLMHRAEQDMVHAICCHRRCMCTAKAHRSTHLSCNLNGPEHVILSCATSMIRGKCCEQGCKTCGYFTCSELLHPLQLSEATCWGACPATPPLPQTCIDISHHQIYDATAGWNTCI